MPSTGPQPSQPAASRGGAPLSRRALAVAVALLALPVCFIVLRCAGSNDVPFIVQGDAAPWIAAPEPVEGTLRQWGREDVPKSVFRRGFELREKPRGEAWLRLRALRAFRVLVNGAPVPGAASDGSRWRDALELDLAPWLAAGRNEIAVEVENPIGPALLSLTLAGIEPELRSNGDWLVSVDGGAPVLAALADDTRPSPHALAVGTPGEALRERWLAVTLLFVAGAAASLVAGRFAASAAGSLASAAARQLASPVWVRRLPALTLALGVVAWVSLFVRKLVHLPLSIGFDANSHLQYVNRIASKHTLPLATDGWSTFHPPFFYALAAAVAGPDANQSDGGQLTLKLLVFAAGLATLVVTSVLAKRLLPDDPAARALAVLFAAVLPMNLYSSAYFSNESLHTLLASLALLVSVDVLLAKRPTTGRLVLLGALFGLAALTKFTVLVLLPIALGFVAFKLWRDERAAGESTESRKTKPREPSSEPGSPGAGFALRLLALLAPIAVIAGWFYLRNWLVFGDPLMANWGRMPGAGHTWWQQPGFHTYVYFARFGEVLAHPYMSGFTSFWNSTYSTFWGDGFIAGRVYPPDRHGFWSYDFMSIGYWLALPATALLIFGAWRGVQLALRDPDPARRAAWALLAASAWVLCLAYLYLALRLGFFGQAKATYLLPLLTPFALWFALGFRGVARCLAAFPFARAVLYGWLWAFAGVLYLGFAG